jgi:hypothetical protein
VQVDAASTSIHIPFRQISVFHRLRFVNYNPYSLNPLDETVVNSIHTNPVHLDKYRNVVPGRFDTVIVRVKDSESDHGRTSLSLKGLFFMLCALVST